MVNESLLNYVENVKKQGFSDSQIKDEIKRAGWSESDTNEVFFIINSKDKSQKKIEPSDEFYFIPNSRVVKPSEIVKPSTTISPAIGKNLPSENTNEVTKLNIIQTPSINKGESTIPIHTETQPSPNDSKPITPENSGNTSDSVVANNHEIVNTKTNTGVDTSKNTSVINTNPGALDSISDQELIRKAEIAETKTKIGKYVVVICTILILVFCVIYYKQIISTVLNIRSKNQDASVINSQLKQIEIYFDYNSDFNIITSEKRRSNSFIAFKGEISVDDTKINDLAGTLEILTYGDKTWSYRFYVSRINGIWEFSPIEFSDKESLLATKLSESLSSNYIIDSASLRGYISKFTSLKRIDLINIEREIFNQINISKEPTSLSLNEKTLNPTSSDSVKIQTKTAVSYSKQISSNRESRQKINLSEILNDIYIDFSQDKLENEIMDIYSIIKKIPGNACESKEFIDQYRIFKVNNPDIDLVCKNNSGKLIIYSVHAINNESKFLCADQEKIIKILTSIPKNYECK